MSKHRWPTDVGDPPRDRLVRKDTPHPQAIPVFRDEEPTNPHDVSNEAIARRMTRQSIAIRNLESGHIEIKTVLAYQNGKLETIADLAERAEEREITKLRLNRPVAIISAIGIAVVAIITAVVAHGCGS